MKWLQSITISLLVTTMLFVTAADNSIGENCIGENCIGDLLFLYRLQNSIGSPKIYIRDENNYFLNEWSVIATWNNKSFYWHDENTFFAVNCTNEEFQLLMANSLDRMDKDEIDYFMKFD